MTVTRGNRRWVRRLTVAAVFLACATSTGGAAATAAPRGCYAEVLYTNHPYGHTYEYLCGRLRLRAGELVRVPVRNGVIVTARIVRISKVRTYFGGPLKTVRSAIT